jgi:hypothetical protein
MGNTAVGIAYLDGPRLRASLLAAADWIDAGKEELDRINVFPVPDGDTGTNFCSTFRAVAEAVRKLGPSPLPTVTKTMTQTCVYSAHGNSGMLALRAAELADEGWTVDRIVREIDRKALIPRVLRHLDGRLTPRPKLLRLGIVHAGAEDIAERLRIALVARYAPRSCFVDDVTSAIGVHVGPGAWGIFYQMED